jgi:hypothetical protein
LCKCKGRDNSYENGVARNISHSAANYAPVPILPRLGSGLIWGVAWGTGRLHIQGTAKVGNESDESPIFVSEIQGHSGPPLLGRTKATLKPEIRLSNTDHFGEERFGVESDRTWQLNLSSVGRVFELRRSHHNGALTTWFVQADTFLQIRSCRLLFKRAADLSDPITGRLFSCGCVKSSV